LKSSRFKLKNLNLIHYWRVTENNLSHVKLTLPESPLGGRLSIDPYTPGHFPIRCGIMSPSKIVKSTTSVNSCVARTIRILRKTWAKCTKCEENSKLLVNLLDAGVGTAGIEEFILKEGKNRKAGGNGAKKDRKETIKVLMEGKINDSKKLGFKLKKKKSKLRKKVASECGSERKTKNVVAKLRKNDDRLRENLRKEHQTKVRFLVHKYGEAAESFKLPSEISRYEKCKIFKKNCEIISEELNPIWVGGGPYGPPKHIFVDYSNFYQRKSAEFF
jgi:hypothetical protein